MLFKKPMVAIDIGSKAIKILDTQRADPIKIKKAGIEYLPGSAIVDGSIIDSAAVANALKLLLKRLKISTRGRRVAISIGGSSVIIKKISFPLADDLEIAQMVETEAEQHFQYSLDELYYTWHILENSLDASQSHVLLVGAKKDFVNQHMAVVKAVGFKIGVVDCDVFAATNMLEFTNGITTDLIGLINIGSSVTQVSFVENGNPIFTREIAMGGNNFTHEIVKQMGIGFDEAETLKITLSEERDSSQPKMLVAINKISAQIASEIQLTIDFFLQKENNKNLGKTLRAIYLCGGASSTFGLIETIAKTTQAEVGIINPFQGVDISKSVASNLSSSESNLFSVAIGLCLREEEDG